MAPRAEEAAPAAGRTCPVCGFRNRPVARYCGDCGESFGGPAPGVPARSRTGAAFAGAAVLVLAAGAPALFWGLRREPPQRPAAVAVPDVAQPPAKAPPAAEPPVAAEPAPAERPAGTEGVAPLPAPAEGSPEPGAPPAAPGERPALPKLTDQDFADYMAGEGGGAAGAVGMSLVPAGRFWMGADGGNRNERPRRRVELDAFLIDRFEVTVEDYGRCVAAGACSKPETHGRCNWDWPDRKRHPVNCVSWEQAHRFCAWAGKRLPTEAQWEKAARGADGRSYPWGERPPEAGTSRANGTGAEDGFATTAPVGSFPSGAGPFGAADMAGNVAEWTADWYDPAYYQGGPSRNPAGPKTGGMRTVRGGSWFSPPAELRASLRVGYPPEAALDLAGFRCAADATEEGEAAEGAKPAPSRSGRR